MERFADRLRRAIPESRLKNSRQLERALKRAGVAGATRQAIYRYSSGAVAPSIDWAVAAAKALEVSPMWLILGEGDPRPAATTPPRATVYTPPAGLLPGTHELWREVLGRATAWFLDRDPGDGRDVQEEVRAFAKALLESVLRGSGGLAISARPLDHRRAQTLALLAADQMIPETRRERLMAAGFPPETATRPSKRPKGRSPRKEKSR